MQKEAGVSAGFLALLAIVVHSVYGPLKAFSRESLSVFLPGETPAGGINGRLFGPHVSLPTR